MNSNKKSKMSKEQQQETARRALEMHLGATQKLYETSEETINKEPPELDDRMPPPYKTEA